MAELSFSEKPKLSLAAEAPATAMPHSTHRHSAAHKIRFHRVKVLYPHFLAPRRVLTAALHLV